MRKKLIILLVVTLLVCTALLGLTACNKMTYNKVDESAATCDAAGQKEHYVGSDEKLYIKDDKDKYVATTEEDLAIPALGHSYGEATYTWNTDNTACTAIRTCTNDASHVEKAVATITSEELLAPTCTLTGKKKCTATFDKSWASTQVKEVEIAALGHSYGEVTYEWNADNTVCTATGTCTKDASHVETITATITSEVLQLGSCSVKTKENLIATFSEEWATTQTKEVYTDYVHTLNKVEGVAATFTTAGLKEYYTCSSCGKNFEDSEGKTVITDLETWKVIPTLDGTITVYENKHAEVSKTVNHKYADTLDKYSLVTGTKGVDYFDVVLYKDADCTQEILDLQAFVTANKDKTIYALKEYQVTFYADGATINPNVTTITFKHGENYGVLPVATKPNYIFSGWYTEDNVLVEDNGNYLLEANCTLIPKLETASVYNDGTSFKRAIDIDLTAEKGVGIDEAGKQVYFKFVPEVSTVYSIESIYFLDTYGYLYDDKYNLLTENNQDGTAKNLKIKYYLEAEKTYYIVAKLYDPTETGAFSLKITKPFDTVTDIDLTAEKEANINEAGKQHCFKFVSNETILYDIESLGVFDTYAYLYDSTFNLLQKKDQGGTSNNFRIRYYFESGKTYYIAAKIYGDNKTGTFNVQVTKPFDTITDIDLTAPKEANIDVAGKKAVFKFIPEQTTLYAIESLGELDTYGYLYDEGYKLLEEIDDIGSERNFKIQHRLEAGKVYYIEAKIRNNTLTGVFNVQITKPLDTAIDIDLTAPKEANIDVAGKKVVFKFVPEHTILYYINSISNLDTYATLYDENHKNLIENDESGEGHNFKIQYELEAGKTYYIEVGMKDATLTGKFNVQIINLFDTAIDIDLTAEKEVNIDVAGKQVCFKFIPEQTNIYDIESLGKFYTYGYLYDEKYELLAKNNGTGSQRNFKIQHRLETGKVYYIEAKMSAGSATGVFNVKISKPFDTATDIDLTAEKEVNIDVAGKQVIFKFVPEETNIYTIESLGDLDTYGYLYDEVFNILMEDDDGGIKQNFLIKYKFEAGKTYYIVAKMCYTDKTGKFNVKTTKLFDTAIDIDLTAPKEANIDVAGKQVVFKFVPEETNIYDIESLGELDTYGFLCDDNYNVLKQENQGGIKDNFKIRYEMKAGNTYFIKVKMYYSTVTGKFNVQITKTFDTITDIDSTAPQEVNIDVASKQVCFKFIPEKTTLYNIESLGDFDTYGYLYNNQFGILENNDDKGEVYNFKIQRGLEAGKTYYIVAKIHDSTLTGVFNVKIAETFEDAKNINISSPQEVNIDVGEKQVFFKFTPIATQIYNIETVGELDTELSLFKETGEKTKEGTDLGKDNNARIICKLEAGKTYYIMTGLKSINLTGTYNVKITKPVEITNDISFNSLKEVNINSPGETVCFKYVPSEKKRGLIKTTGESIKYAYIYSQREEIQEIETLNNLCFDIEMEKDVEYYIVVSLKDETLTDSFTLEIVDPFLTAQELTLSTSTSVNIERSNQIVYFKFTPVETRDYVIESSGELDTYGYLYDEKYELKAKNDDGNPGGNFKIQYKLEAGKTYYIGAKNYSSTKTGQFEVKIS